MRCGGIFYDELNFFRGGNEWKWEPLKSFMNKNKQVMNRKSYFSTDFLFPLLLFSVNMTNNDLNESDSSMKLSIYFFFDAFFTFYIFAMSNRKKP